jgi:predicted small integral membrane protein
MIRIKWLAVTITSTQVRLAIAFALAATVLLDLTIVHRTQTAQVVEGAVPIASTTDDVIDVGSLGSASWHCAGVAITQQCGPTQAVPDLGAIKVGNGIASSWGQ